MLNNICTMWLVVCGLFVFTSTVLCEDVPEVTEPVSQDIENATYYNSMVLETLRLDKWCENETKNVEEGHSISMVDTMTNYRMQMMLHRNKVLHETDNQEWSECKTLNQHRTKAAEDRYYAKEKACCRRGINDLEEKKTSIAQIRKEMRTWRKGLKYLMNVCRESHEGDKLAIKECLDNYRSQDNYLETIFNIISIQENTIAEYKQISEDSVMSMSRCLETSLSQYFEELRGLMNILYKCYNKKLSSSSKN